MVEIDPAGHGNSPAAWTTVIIILIAVFMGIMFYMFEQPWGVVASIILAIIGFIVGGIVRAAGWGANGRKFRAKYPD